MVMKPGGYEMIKRALIFAVILLSLSFPAFAVQELDGNADGLIDDTLFSAYNNLSTNSKIGAGAAQVSQGNHTHSYLGGTLSATSGAMVCTTGTGQATAAACSGVGSAGLVKWGATGIPATATAGSDYVATETDPVVLAINGIVKSNTSTIAAATRADYAAAQIIGTNTTPTTTDPYTLDAANAYGTIIRYNATGTINLPAGVAGMNLIIYNHGANVITIDPNGTEIVVRDGTVQAAGVSFTLSSGAGNFVAIFYDGTAWVTLGFKGSLGAGT